MSVRTRKRAVLVVVIGAVAIAAHLLLGTVAAWSMWQWLGASGVVVAGVVLVVVHVAGLRRLAIRRASGRRDADATD